MMRSLEVELGIFKLVSSTAYVSESVTAFYRSIFIRIEHLQND